MNALAMSKTSHNYCAGQSWNDQMVDYFAVFYGFNFRSNHERDYCALNHELEQQLIDTTGPLISTGRPCPARLALSLHGTPIRSAADRIQNGFKISKTEIV
jgi:hypothetical protein